MELPQLPLEVLSNITALITPPFHPPDLVSDDHDNNSGSSSSSEDADNKPTTERHSPPQYLIDALDPHPGLPYTPLNTVSAVSKSSHRLLEAARPWLWENVDVRSGRGWLAIVNALTEEVLDDPQLALDVASSLHKPDAVLPTQPVGVPITPISPLAEIHNLPPVPAAEAHAQPNTVPGGFHRYISHPALHNYPSPYPMVSTPTSGNTMGIHIPPQRYDYSPPQPSQPSLLLTPPGSRGSSPHVSSGPPSEILPVPSTAGGQSSPTPLSKPSSAASSIKAASAARLRGRSRSPRRSVGFDSKALASVASVLERSHSVENKGLGRGISPGGSWPRRIPLERRRSSLSRARTMSDNGYEEDDEADEEDDKVSPLPPKSRHNTEALPTPPPQVDEVIADDDDDAMGGSSSDLLPPPGPYIRHLSFNNFRTIGSRRTQDEAVRGRFVTAGRLEGVIKNCPNLISLCMTEYVDSSLSFPVMEDILFRGYRRPRKPRRMSISATLTRQRSLSVDANPAYSPLTTISQLDPPRPDYVPYEDETEDDKWKRRGMFTPLQALDLTGCVSGVFTKAMVEFWSQWLDPEHDDMDDDRGRGRRRSRLVFMDAPSSTEDDEEDDLFERHTKNAGRRTPRFPAMRRLSLRACTTLDPAVLYDLVLAFPNLTHLDLSNTRVPSSLLASLTESPPKNMRLKSLSLARCPRLEPTAIVDFLVLSTATRELVELNLYMNPTQANAITTSDLDRLLTAPCIKSGRLRYLDLSSAGITQNHLHPSVFPAQPSLLSLGLSHIPTLPLRPIADFLLYSAPNVEILTLTGTAFDSSLNPSATSLQTTLELHAHLINPLTTVPFSLASLSLNSPSAGPDLRPGATRLRVIELSSSVRRAIADGGSGEWKVVKSKGGRGWYVDLSAGWIPAVDQYPGVGEASILREDVEKTMRFVRHLPASHPRREFLAGLASASGRVGSAVGWHSRKMEVIRGMGMLGREEGMAGVGGFAFEE